MSEATDNLEPDALIAGRYRVRQQLGKGGMGTVYEVYDERQHRAVALKLLQLRRSGPGSSSAALFEREYHTLYQLAHPRVIQVFDYGLEEGRAFYTMELLDGQDLQSLGVVPWARACALLNDLASSLAILHSRRLVHRDVSARNVRCTSGGHAKLYDFGAMAPMGIVQRIVGTPPYLPPEAVEMQGLDGRSDLYAMGALAYLLLTGYHAYEAHSVAALRSIWRSAPMLPSQYVPDIPHALDRLVMELLQLERGARPSTAAEVMERLSGIAQLPLNELPQVRRSYFVMPRLVGRDVPVDAARELLRTTATTRRGGALLLVGEAGVGRTRCLDACLLEARLLGAQVLRTDAADSAARGEYGAARALCEQLFQADPDACQRVGERRGASLGFLLPELFAGNAPEALDASPLAAPGSSEVPAVPERRVLLGAAQELMQEAARATTLVIGVDDADAIDEPSAALLGMLARLAKQRAIVVIASSRGVASGPALAVLRDGATRIELGPLDAEQNESLLRSVFGDVAHVAALAATVLEITGGNPRAIMTLTEDLIERGVARYEAGSWSLPAQLQAEDLPRSLSAALLARVAALSADARELADALSLLEAPTIGLEQCPDFPGPPDHGRVHRALDELLSAGVLARTGERYRFSQVAIAERLAAELEPARASMLHARIARALEDANPRDPRLPRHWLFGGQDRKAIERLCETLNAMRAVPLSALPLLAAAVSAAERIGIGVATQLELRAHLLLVAASAGRRDVFEMYARDARAQCLRDTGLADCEAVRTDPMMCSDSLLQFLQQRYAALSPEARGVSPERVDAIVSRVWGAHFTLASVCVDPTAADLLPRLDPFYDAFPTWRVNQACFAMVRHAVEGRNALAGEIAAALIETIDNASDPRIDARALPTVRLAALYMLASFAATSANPLVASWVAELERTPGLRSNAWRIRMVYELMQGNLGAAAECQRRAELLHIQDSDQPSFATPLRIELLAHMYSDNVLGMKRVMERADELALRFPGWQPTAALARCHYRRLQGDPAGALAALEPALGLEVGRHYDWWLAGYSHVKVLCELDRCAEAVELGEGHVRTWLQAQLSSVDYGLQQVTAEALTRVGRHAEARRMIERYLRSQELVGTRGLRLGIGYETAARIAMAEGDELAVRRYTELCAYEYKGGRDLLLKAKLDRLLREADDCVGATPERMRV